MRKNVLLAVGFILLAFTTACENGNIFSWTHTPGSSSSAPALIADGNAALQNKQYSKAVEYFQRAIDSDPTNSEAIYGYSSARLAEAGLDVGNLVANLVRQPATSPMRLAQAMETITYVVANNTLIPDSIIANKTALLAALNDVIAQLSKIAKGTADGTISPTNPDININLAFCFILRAGLRIVDLVDFNNDYTASVKPGVTNDQLRAVADDSAKDVINAYHRLKVVVDELHLSNSATITKISDDVRSLFDDFKAKVNAVDHTLITADIDIDYI
jgi:tetratricopeptide (TPR) repeat protein